MNDSALFDQLSSKLRTKADVLAVFTCLEEFTNTFFSAKSQEEQQQIFRKLPKEIAEPLIESLTKSPVTPEDQIAIKRRVDVLSSQLRACKSITLTIAFQANDDTITYFSDWVKKNIKPDLLIDLHYDNAIVGGALLIASGVYKDYSVRKNLATRFQIQRDEIMGLLNE